MNEWTLMGLISTGVITVMLALWVGASYMEAQAYEQLVGTKVTTLQAMFVQLRVDGC